MPIDVISWNIKNLGSVKLDNATLGSAQLAGVGNNVLDYIIKVLARSTILATGSTGAPTLF